MKRWRRLACIVVLGFTTLTARVAMADCVADSAKLLEEYLYWALYQILPNDNPFEMVKLLQCTQGGRHHIIVQGTIEIPYDLFLNATQGVHLQGIEDATLVIKSMENFNDKNLKKCAVVLASNNHKIENITIHNPVGPGICITGNNNIIVNNAIPEASGAGIILGGTTNTVTGNTISQVKGAGITINQNGHTITKNAVTNSGFFGFAYANKEIACVHDLYGNSVTTTGGANFNACTVTTCPDGKPLSQHPNFLCCPTGTTAVNDPTLGPICQALADTPPPSGGGGSPNPEPKKETGPKCSANQMLFGGTLCCDPKTEIPNFVKQACDAKQFQITKPPETPTVIPPTTPPDEGAGANNEENCALHPAADDSHRVRVGSAWLLIAAAMLLWGFRAIHPRQKGPE